MFRSRRGVRNVEKDWHDLRPGSSLSAVVTRYNVYPQGHFGKTIEVEGNTMNDCKVCFHIHPFY